MIRALALAGLALAATLSGTAPTSAKVSPKPSAQNGHAHHLLKAEKDLEAAQTAISGQNLKQAHKDVKEAIHQVEEAIHHHHKHHIAPQGQSGTTPTAHHKHHEHLKQVVAELKVAEKELHEGSAQQASKEIHKAEKTLKTAIESHKKLFGS
jgi:hypothetical protein